ncbi:hypothetical protein EDC04DRAFT_2597989 [Pisolithus marmoratus]|nr:hypothetical protein EDC04DRAFT_2597989 [Pisolithus marmoratus]
MTDIEDGSDINTGVQESNAGEEPDKAFDMEELEILAHWQRDWMQASKKKKPSIFHALCQEVSKLEKHRTSSEVELKTLEEVVVCELYHDQLQKKLLAMWEADGTRLGKLQINLCQQALTTFMEDELTEEELETAHAIAKKWNGPQGPTAEEMWRYCGMQLAFSQGGEMRVASSKHASCSSMDFNDEIYEGNTFNDIHTLDGPWCNYVGAAFKEQGEPKGDAEPSQERPTAKAKKVDPVSLVTANNGEIWVGPITGLSCTMKQQMLGQYQQEMIALQHLPSNFTFNVDPSHMHVTMVVKLLNFWCRQQETDPGDVFAFQKWIDSLGNLQDPITCEEYPLLIARGRQSRSQTPAPPTPKKVPRRRSQGQKKKILLRSKKGGSMDYADGEMNTSGADTNAEMDAETNAETKAETNVGTDAETDAETGDETESKTPMPCGPPNEEESNDDDDSTTGAVERNVLEYQEYGMEKRSQVKPRGRLWDTSEYHDGGIDVVPFVDRGTTLPHMPKAKSISGKLKPTLKQTGHAISDATVVGKDIDAHTWKSPQIHKIPQKADADFPSPPIRKSSKQKTIVGKTSSRKKQKTT